MKEVTVADIRELLNLCRAVLLKQLIKKKRVNRATRRKWNSTKVWLKDLPNWSE